MVWRAAGVIEYAPERARRLAAGNWLRCPGTALGRDSVVVIRPENDRVTRKNGGEVRVGTSRLFEGALLALASLVAVQALSSGCSSRSETPTMGADSTLVYPAKNPSGVEASIVFCSEAPSKTTGMRRGVRDLFTAGEKAKVYAFVDLKNQFALGDRPLELHLVWIGPDDESFFTKRVDYVPSDSTTTLRSRITIAPERRDPGRYLLRVYLFRELIAERAFEVRHRT
jgi:hypothetical protein